MPPSPAPRIGDMQLVCSILLFLVMEPAPEAVALSTSRTNPYVGELIELKLTIRTLPSTTPLELVIPGLSPQEEWRFMMNAWLRKPAKQPPGTLPMRFRNFILYAQT